jgi:CMP-N-acetylneuraminic acid synthetase
MNLPRENSLFSFSEDDLNLHSDNMNNLSEQLKEILAIIPARGGSKGVSRKNVLPLAGKPLIVHSIEQAQQSKYISRIVVSTDDSEIAAAAVNAGADVIWRPPEISGDGASSESALIHTLQHLDESEGYRPDMLVFLQCTSPLTRTIDIDGTIESMLDKGADTALAVIPFHYFLWKYNRDQDAIGINHNSQKAQTGARCPIPRSRSCVCDEG